MSEKIPVSATPTPPPQGEAAGPYVPGFNTKGRLWPAYLIAVVLPLVTIGGRLAMGFQPGDAPMIILFVIPIFVSAYAGGVGPGLVATAFSALLADYYLLRPPGGVPLLTGLKSTQWQVMMVVGVLISAMTEALHLARQRFHAILNTALDAIVVIDHAGRIVEFSPTAERMFGQAASAVIGRNMGEVIVPPAMRERHRMGMARYLATGEARILGQRTELTAMRADGTEFPVEVSIQRIAGVRPPLFTGFIRDITERKRAQETLRRSEASLAQAQHIARLGSWDLDLSNLSGNPLRWSDEVFRLFGYEPGGVQVSNELFFRHVHPDDRQKIKDAVAETLRTGRTYSIDHRIILPDGTERVIHELADLIRDEQGRPLRMMGTAQDVTERWRAEELLRQSEERFRQMIANGSDIIALVDQQGVIRFQSPSTERVLGHRPEYMAGRRIEEYIHAEDLAKVGAAMERVLAGQEKPLPVEYRCRHRDGSWRTLQSFGKAMTGSTGEKLIVVNSRDVTESRALEEQLRQSQKMEAIGQLSGGIAHDFNNLLTAIIGHLGLLRGNPQVTPQIAESLGEISAAANRAANLTSQLLSFSRRQVISVTPLDLNEVVTNLSKMLRRVLGEQVTVQLDFLPEELTFQGDAGMMEQVLVNLAVNARDAMPQGGTLRITTRRETRVPPAREAVTAPAPGEFVRLSVGDTGTGILPEFRAKIFEPFFTTKGVGKGTGLGLATVFGIVQQHHGWIEVESEVGRGTTFHLYLPRLARPPTTHPVGESAQPAQPARAARGRDELILVVEDEPAVQQIVMQALGRYDYRVLLAANGPEALKIWAERKAEIALLLTDLIMPEGITGLQLARLLLEEKPLLRVVYTSGYSADIAGKELKLTDGVNYLAKPYELDRLFRTVRTALDRRQSSSPF